VGIQQIKIMVATPIYADPRVFNALKILRVFALIKIMSTFDKFVLLVQEFRTSEKLSEAEVKVLTKLIQYIVKKSK
jgi:hypothetical protein